jgi:hypothetical protein
VSESVAFNILANQLAALIRAGARQQNEVQIFLRSRLGDPSLRSSPPRTYALREKGAPNSASFHEGKRCASVSPEAPLAVRFGEEPLKKRIYLSILELKAVLEKHLGLHSLPR